MNSKTAVGIYRLIRPLNVAIASLTVGAAIILADPRARVDDILILGMFTAALVTAGANAINDFFDYEIDRINRPDRPIPRGDITRRIALTVWIVSSVGSISINIFLHSGALTIVVGSLVLLYWYSAYWKRTPLAGNIVVALMTGMAFVYGGAVAGDVRRTIVPAVFAALINLAREIVKDVEDMEGDQYGKAQTYPIRFGKKNALVLVSAVILVLVASLWVPVAVGVYGLVYALLVLPVNAILLLVVVKIWKDGSRENLGRQSALLKMTMVLGLIAVFTGSFWT